MYSLVVFGLADKADAAAERQREESARAGRHLGGTTAPVKAESPYETQLRWIAQMQSLGQFTDEQADEERRKAREKYGVSDDDAG